MERSVGMFGGLEEGRKEKQIPPLRPFDFAKGRRNDKWGTEGAKTGEDGDVPTRPPESSEQSG